jgi:predicted component of type VI protein secretion system
MKFCFETESADEAAQVMNFILSKGMGGASATVQQQTVQQQAPQAGGQTMLRTAATTSFPGAGEAAASSGFPGVQQQPQPQPEPQPQPQTTATGFPGGATPARDPNLDAAITATNRAMDSFLSSHKAAEAKAILGKYGLKKIGDATDVATLQNVYREFGGQ